VGTESVARKEELEHLSFDPILPVHGEKDERLQLIGEIADSSQQKEEGRSSDSHSREKSSLLMEGECPLAGGYQ